MKENENSLFQFYKKVDLSSKEISRIYVFPGGDKVKIDSPQFLIVFDNGHLILDGKKISHYIPNGWIHLYWINKDDILFYYEDNKKDEKNQAAIESLSLGAW